MPLHPITQPFSRGIALVCLLTAGQLAAQPYISAGDYHACVVTTGNTVRCWGLGSSGRLGYGNIDTIGDNEDPVSAGDVNVGADVSQVSAGSAHTCVVTTGNTVRCWGAGGNGQLGYAAVANIGDNEVPADSGDIDVGAAVMQVSAGGTHTCVVTTGNTVRCWGAGVYGQLGYGSISSIGETDVPADSGDVNVGAAVSQVSTGDEHTCVVTTGNAVRCWGHGVYGRLGYRGVSNIGDDEVPADSGDVNVGLPVAQVSAGGSHTCVVTTGNTVRCWGYGGFGALGYGNIFHIGDTETPASAGDVDVGLPVSQVSAGYNHTCAVTTGNTVRCWGFGGNGRLGYGSTANIGDDETPADSGDVNVGLPVSQVSVGNGFTCALTTANTVRCWGFGGAGRLGYGNGDSIGDDEDPAAAGDVIVFDEQLLPVELSAFDVRVEGDRAVLNWSTASETDNAGFEVQHLFERSGQTFWDVAGFVEGSGSTDSPQSYSFEISALEPGSHRFRLKQVDLDGAFELSPEVEAVVDVPGSHYLSDAYPNPFNPRSYFSVAVPSDQPVTVTLHDAMGRRVRTLFEGELQANEQHWVMIDGSGLASGAYLYRVEGKNFTESRSVTFQK